MPAPDSPAPKSGLRAKHLQKTIMLVVGTRPNFMKIAPLMRAIDRATSGTENTSVRLRQVLVHTGQHYDDLLSGTFLRELGMPDPDYHLGCGSGSHAEQTARILVGMQAVLGDCRPDLVIVPGDTNSALAAALAAVQSGHPVAHLEAGLRSRDRGMPEEINRVVIDHLAEVLLTTCEDAAQNLAVEGIELSRVWFVGNPMIDSLDRIAKQARRLLPSLKRRFGLNERRLVLVTLHRPSNVDVEGQLSNLVRTLEALTRDVDVLFPVHRRTQARLRALGMNPGSPPQDCRRAGSVGRLLMTDPLPYEHFVAFMTGAALVVTDSGGVQEETTALGVPCITVRTTTERPVTISVGTNTLVNPSDHTALLATARARLAKAHTASTARPKLWDGHAAERASKRLLEWLTEAV